MPNYVADVWKQADGHELGRLTWIDQGDGQVRMKVGIFVSVVRMWRSFSRIDKMAEAGEAVLMHPMRYEVVCRLIELQVMELPLFK